LSIKQIRKERPAVLRRGAVELAEEVLAIDVVVEDRTAVVSPCRQVVVAAGDFDPKRIHGRDGDHDCLDAHRLESESAHSFCTSVSTAAVGTTPDVARFAV
jgi:hypothetical protein